MKTVSLQRGRVWSATPTPFLNDGRVDEDSVRRLITHHADLGVTGLMLAGTCGEGSWIRDRDRERLVRAAVEAAAGKLVVALQVTDNSDVRVMDNIEAAAGWGVDMAVVASPHFFLNAKPARLLSHYVRIARGSSLPVGFYDRGAHSPYSLPEELLPELLAEPNIVAVKDSSQDPARRALYLKARDARPGLVLFTGSEFDCAEYLLAGYDGVLLGGGIFNGAIAVRIVAAAKEGRSADADALQARMNDLMYRVYGGRQIECWLSGLKELLVRLGIFSTRYNLLEYPLTASCLAQIEAALSGSDGLGFRADLIPARRSFTPLRG